MNKLKVILFIIPFVGLVLGLTSCGTEVPRDYVGLFQEEKLKDGLQNYHGYDLHEDFTLTEESSFFQIYDWNEGGDTVVWLHCKTKVDGKWKYKSNKSLRFSYDIKSLDLNVANVSRVWTGGYDTYSVEEIENMPVIKSFVDDKYAEIKKSTQEEYRKGKRFENIELQIFGALGIHETTIIADTPEGKAVLIKYPGRHIEDEF